MIDWWIVNIGGSACPMWTFYKSREKTEMPHHWSQAYSYKECPSSILNQLSAGVEKEYLNIDLELKNRLYD